MSPPRCPDGVPSRAIVWLVANPAAGSARRTGPLHTAVGALTHAGWTITWHPTRGRLDAADIAARAARQGIDLVLVAGGDGTVNEVANGLAGSATALALLPAGTGNVLAAQLGLVALPTPLHRPDPVTAAARLAAGTLCTVDLGYARSAGAGGRYFVLWAGVGLDAEIVRHIEEEGRALKRAVGPVAYAAVGMRFLLETRGTPALLRCDAARSRHELLMAVVANVPLYAGAVHLAPAARIDDGMLDLVAFDGSGLPDTLRHLAVLTTGRPGADGIENTARTRRVSLVTALPMPVHLDAEPHGHTPLRVSVAPRSLRLLVPSGAPGDLFADQEPGA